MKCRHFDTTELIEAESWAVLNTLALHNFLDAFKKWQKRWERPYALKGTSSRVMVASRPQSHFLTRWQHQSKKMWLASCVK
jgi:hypothetical protein